MSVCGRTSQADETELCTDQYPSKKRCEPF